MSNKFLEANIIEDSPTQKYLADSLQLSVSEISKLQKEHAVKLKHIQKIRNIFKRKKYTYLKKEGKSMKEENISFQFKSFKEFYDWYMKFFKNCTCCYCGVSEEDLNKAEFFKRSKRGRGKVFEIERIVTYPEEKNIYSVDNCQFACHICNNAKSDFLDVKEFEFIAKGINALWVNHLDGKEVKFPNEIYNDPKYK